MVRGVRLELGGARVDRLEGRHRARRDASRTHFALRHALCAGGHAGGHQECELRVGEPARASARAIRRGRGTRAPSAPPLAATSASRARRADEMSSSWSRNHRSTPVAAATTSTGIPRRSAASSSKTRPGVGRADASEQLVVVKGVGPGLPAVGVQPGAPLLQGPDRLLQRFGEGAADRHDLADRLHAGAETVRCARQLLESPSGDLGHHVVDRRLEARGRRPGYVVGDLVERVADGEPGGDLRDREARRLRGRALDRDTRGFISMTSRLPVSGLTANWMLEPPVSTPTRRMQAKASSRIAWYSSRTSV